MKTRVIAEIHDEQEIIEIDPEHAIIELPRNIDGFAGLARVFLNKTFTFAVTRTGEVLAVWRWFLIREQRTDEDYGPSGKTHKELMSDFLGEDPE
jgi:hypothetical protein